MLVLNLPFKALMFLTLMRPSLVLFLVLWLKLVKDFLKVRCRLALLPFLISRSEERRVGKECRSGGALHRCNLRIFEVGSTIWTADQYWDDLVFRTITLRGAS